MFERGAGFKRSAGFERSAGLKRRARFRLGGGLVRYWGRGRGRRAPAFSATAAAAATAARRTASGRFAGALGWSRSLPGSGFGGRGYDAGGLNAEVHLRFAPGRRFAHWLGFLPWLQFALGRGIADGRRGYDRFGKRRLGGEVAVKIPGLQGLRCGAFLFCVGRLAATALRPVFCPFSHTALVAYSLVYGQTLSRGALDTGCARLDRLQ